SSEDIFLILNELINQETREKIISSLQQKEKIFPSPWKQLENYTGWKRVYKSEQEAELAKYSLTDGGIRIAEIKIGKFPCHIIKLYKGWVSQRYYISEKGFSMVSIDLEWKTNDLNEVFAHFQKRLDSEKAFSEVKLREKKDRTASPCEQARASSACKIKVNNI